MTISAQIISDSISDYGIRLTTLQLRYPRFIHSEFMTHRVFSRNASSSRAIPVARLIEDVRLDPVIPSFWGKNQPGMQADEECNEPIWKSVKFTKEEAWVEAMEDAIEWAEKFSRAGYHKQIVNRLLEPFSHINVVVTATEWDNFFKLRLHKDAQPEIHELAKCMKEAMDSSEPEFLSPGEWHLPYIILEDRDKAKNLEELLKVSVARCARVSYKTHDGKKTDFEKDKELFEKLILASPPHMSPAEHQARVPDDYDDLYYNEYYQGNFDSWFQFRKILEEKGRLV